MDPTIAGRTLMGDSLGFHIIIALLSIGIPFLMNIFGFFAWKKKDARSAQFVRLLVRWTAVLAVAGAISGTVVSIQFSTLWAPFLAYSQPYVGQFFALEGYAFLIEVIFLAWYLVREKKASPRTLWLLGLPVTLGAIGSAFFITIINAWMNNPSAVWTSTTTLEISHSVTAYLFATTLLVIGYVAWRIWRKKTDSKDGQRLILQLGIIGFVLLIVVAVLGDASAVNDATAQPTKLAAMEILDKTQTNAPLRIGGEINADGTAQGGIVLPGALSLLAGRSLGYEVQGLDKTPRDQWPLLIVHSIFDIKIFLVGYTSVLLLALLVFRWRLKRQPRWFLLVLAISGVLGIVLVELGWMITELGRQPWAVAGKLLVSDAFTKNVDVVKIGYIFPCLFVVLLAATIFALKMVTKKWHKVEDVKW